MAECGRSLEGPHNCASDTGGRPDGGQGEGGWTWEGGEDANRKDRTF